MAQVNTSTPATIRIHAFGETREVDGYIVQRDDDERGYHETAVSVGPVFAGRLRTSAKLWKVYSNHLRESAKEPGVYELASSYVVILNRQGYICGWWNEEKFAGRNLKSHHNSAQQ